MIKGASNFFNAFNNHRETMFAAGLHKQNVW